MTDAIFHVENDPRPPSKTWVGPPGISGLDRPMIRRRRGRWVIQYGGRLFFMYENSELKTAYLFAMWMTEGFWR